MNKKIDPNRTIDAFGGTCAVAEICRVTAQAVSQWRTDGIPDARLMYLQLLRPDLFAEDYPAPKKAA